MHRSLVHGLAPLGGVPGEADLFGDECPPDGHMRVEISGVLLADAQVRVKPVGDGSHMLPVLCLEISPSGAGGYSVHAEQVYYESARGRAEDQAKQLKKGAHVCIRTNLLDMRVLLPHIERITLGE